MRIKLTVAYNGLPYLGLQTQSYTDRTVLGTMHKVLDRLGITDRLIASGRTDRGVHATGQVLHCDLPAHWQDLGKLLYTLNTHLPHSIRVKKIEEVADDFHARYSARRRVYRYILSDAVPNPFEADFVTFHKVPLNLDLLNDAMQHFIGTHDFDYFKKSGSDTTNFVRTIYRAFAYRHQGKVVLYFEADGYLRSQIRMMTGFLLGINDGRLTIGQLKEQLAVTTQHYTKLAPEYGLYLAKIKYGS